MITSMSMILHGLVDMPLHEIMPNYADPKKYTQERSHAYAYAFVSAYDFANAQTSV